MIYYLSLLLPEIVLFAVLLLLFIQSAAETHFKLPSARYWLPLAGVALTVAGAFSLNNRGSLFHATYTIDGLSQFFKLLVVSGYLALVLNASFRLSLPKHKESDYFLFMTFSTLGLLLLASTTELISIYIALELASYSLYILIPLRDRSRAGAEAGAKYIMFGAAATALSLYGLSLIMAEAPGTLLADLSVALDGIADNFTLMAGFSLFLCGMFYKLALFPFHFWCPDVYQGAANETASFTATLPKLGAVVILVRMAAMFEPGQTVTDILASLGMISMFFGNLCALVQKDLKRMLGFSSVAHAGYIMVGLVTGTADGLASAIYYAVAYLAMNLLCFWVLCRISMSGRNICLCNLKGLHKKSPVLAFCLAVAAVAMVGIPPTIGFMGKFLLIASAWGHGYNWLVIGLAVNSAIAIYYYLNMVRYAYAEPDSDQHQCRGGFQASPCPAACCGRTLEREETRESHACDRTVCGPEGSLTICKCPLSKVLALLLACAVILLGAFPAYVYEYALMIARQLR